MFRNLEAELARAGITKCELARQMKKTPSTMSMKLNGKSPLSLAEAAEIKKIVGTDMPLEYLFDNGAELSRETA